MRLAYSTLNIKSVDGEEGQKRTFTGIASTPTTDRQDDIVEPMGAVFKLPIPLLWQHDSRQPIGWVTAAKVSKDGIEIEGEVADIPEDGTLKERLAMAWQSIKAKLVRGLSIGFNSIEHTQIDGTWGYRFVKWEWLELSAVTIPANQDASITAIKAADTQTRAALGLTRKGVVRLGNPPGASGNQTGEQRTSGALSNATLQGLTMKTIAERIAEFEAKKAENVKQLTEMVNKSLESGETLDAEEKALRLKLTDENKEIDEHIKMLKEHQATMATTVTEVTTQNTDTVDKGAELRSGNVTSVRRNLARGTAFVRYAMALAHSKGNLVQAEAIAKRWKDTTPEVGLVLNAAMNMGSTNLKAAVAVGDSVTSGWASQLVYYENMQSEFIELLRPKTIIGRLPGLRKMPFNVRVAGTTQGSSVGWVGEGAPKPVSAMAFNAVTLGHTKAAGIVVITQELARFSSPSAEALVSDDLQAAMVLFLDQQFIDPAVSAVANVSPASITNGLTPVPSTGNTLAQITADVAALLAKFIAAELDPTQAVWVMKPGTALGLSLKRTSQDVYVFPDIKVNGGTWFGLPVVTSNAVPGSVSGGSIIALVLQNEIFLADDGNITLDVSQEASVQMSSTPTAGAATLVSLWQNNLVGLRAEREINWQRRRDTAVAYIDGVLY